MNGWLRGSPGRWSVVRRVVGVWLVVALALGTVVVPEAWAADYYVDTGGSDGNGGTSGAPWKTLTHALGQVTSGDVVHLAPGTYDTPVNGETFPLALVDGVTVLGDTSNPAGTIISAPTGSQVFFNDDTSLGSTTRLAGVTLRHDADTYSPLMEFAVDAAGMSPQIDHNAFVGGSALEEDGIAYYDDGSGSGSFTATIDNNTFTDIDEAIILTSLYLGSGQVFSPVITNNTFTDCNYPINYTMSSSVEGTVGGLVQGNTFSGTTYDEIYVQFSPGTSGGGLVFNPTITGNDMQGAGSENIYAGLYGDDGYPGDATFAPTITNNTMGYSNYYNIEMCGYYYDIDGDYTIAPTISGNTITAAGSESIYLSLTTLSVSSAAQRNVFSPTITNNTITGSPYSGISVYLTSWENGQMEGTPTISGNNITGAGYGIYWEMVYMSYGTGMDWSITLSNNTITSPGAVGITYSPESMSFSGTGIFNLTMDGNTITDAGSEGIMAYPAYSWYDYNDVTETVLVRGNTVTGSGSDGVYLYFSDQTSNTLDAQITDNFLDGNSGSGLYLASNDLGYNGILVACNTATNNATGFEQHGGGSSADPPADYGGGNLSSPGNNVLVGNTWDFSNGHTSGVMAENNWWGVTDPTTIDSHIYDNEEGTGGAVDFDPYLSAAPTVTIAATLTDAVANDVPPAGASVGDTLQYTAVIDPSTTCGDASVSFTATVDANTTVVPGSVTTTQGMITGESPPTVDVGFVENGQPVTVTWQVVVNGGTSVETQGTVTGTQSGSTLTDDPDVGGATDPTVTSLTTLAPGTVQFAVSSTAVSEAAGTATLDVTRTGGIDGAITVSFASADGTAVAPGDYTAVTGQVSWADQDGATKQIVVPIIDDTNVEGDETFTVTLTDPAGASFVGTPATVTVTIQDNDQAPAIPTLGQWGMLLFSALLLLLGGWLLRRRRWAGAAVAVLLAVGMAATPALAAGHAKLKKKEVHVATVTGVSIQQGMTQLKLDDGTTVTVPEVALDVRKGHVRRAKGEARSARPTIQERRQAHRLRKAESTAKARQALLKAGAPVLVTLRLDRDGSVRRARVLVFDTLAEAQGEFARKTAKRKHPRE